MDRWQYKCVGCGETLDVECDNCGRYLFNGRKKSLLATFKGRKNPDPRIKSARLWLECVHCKHKHFGFRHRCLSIKHTTRHGTKTSLESNRDYFFKEGSSKYRVKGIGKLTRSLIYVSIILILVLILSVIF